MTATETIIRDAIEGGWREECTIDGFITEDIVCFVSGGNDLSNADDVDEWSMSVHKLLLDPTSWQAVGKTRGWPNHCLPKRIYTEGWKHYWLQFISHLADGLTVESALLDLEDKSI